MPLVKKRYRSHNDEEDDDGDEEQVRQASLKKRKTCAPDEDAKPTPTPKPSLPAFQSLPIVYPTINHHSKPMKESKQHTSRPTTSRKDTLERFQGCLSSPPTFPDNLYNAPTSLSDIPPLIASALNYTAKNGQKESVVARKCVFRVGSRQAGHSGPVWCVKWSPFSGNLLLSASADETVKIWDPWRSEKQIWEATVFSGGIRDASFCSDGTSVLFGGFGKRLYHVDIETGKVLLNLLQDAEITNVMERDRSFAFSLISGSILAIDPRDPYMATASSSDSAFTPSSTETDATGRYTRRVSGLPGPISSFAFLPPSSDAQQPLVVTCDPSNRSVSEYALSVWDWDSGRVLSTGLWNYPHSAYFALPHPHLSHFAVLTSENTIPIYSATHPYGLKRKKNRFKVCDPITSSRSQITFSPDGNIMYAGSATGQVHAFDYYSQNLLSSLPVFEAKNSVAAVSHHPILHSVIAVSSWNGSVCVYQ